MTATDERASTGAAARPDRREDLLASAARLFVADGIKATTMEDIARDAGAGKATLYRYFANKDAVIDALLVREAERLQRQLERAVADADAIADQLEAAFHTGIRFFVDHPVLQRGHDEEPGLLLERITANTGPLVSAGLDWFAELVARGVEAGELRRVRPRAVAEVIMRLVLSFFAFPRMALPVDDPAATRTFAHELIAQGLLARTAAHS